MVGGAVQNAMHVTSAFRGHLTCNSLGDFTAVSRGAGARSITVASNYAGTMTITGSTAVGSLTLGGVSDSVTVNPDVGNGGVTINGDVSGTLDLVGFSSSSSGGVTISGAITSTGNVITRKSVSQFVRVGGDIDGTLDIRRDVTSAPREVRCFGNVAGTLKIDGSGFVFAGIQVDGSVTGLVHVVQSLRTDSGGGFVRVLRSLGSANDPGEIRLDNGMSSPSSPLQAYVCINYDGSGRADPSNPDVWHSGSAVKVGSTVYTGPNDVARVHAAPPSCGLGDCNGDGSVDFDDIDPFVALIGFDPGVYPGLAVAVPFMADADCSGAVTFDDIDPFVALIGEPCTTCGGDLMMLSGDGDGDSDWLRDPRVLAAQLRASVSPERMNTLIDAVTALAANPPDGSTIPWDLVLVELMP